MCENCLLTVHRWAVSLIVLVHIIFSRRETLCKTYETAYRLGVPTMQKTQEIVSSEFSDAGTEGGVL